MSDELTELRESAEHDELLAGLAERRADELAGGLGQGRDVHRHQAGVALTGPSILADEFEGARWRADFAARRLAWLEGRVRELTAAARRRDELTRAQSAGLERFAGRP